MTIALETAHDRMFEDLTRFVRGELSFRSNEMERRFLRELAWVWTEFRDTEDGKSMRTKFATEYWSEKALKKIYKISSGCEGDIDLNSSAVKLIYTTNAIEGFNRQLRKVSKNRTVFPTDDALFKILYLAMKDITAKWIGKPFNWALTMSQLMLMYPERLPYEELV